MRVIENGDAVGRNINHFFDRFGKIRQSLMRQTVNQINIDAFVTEFTRPNHSLARDFFRLHAVDRFLHLQIKILHAETRAVKTDVAECFEMFTRQVSRVNLDARFQIVGEIKFRFDK